MITEDIINKHYTSRYEERYQVVKRTSNGKKAIYTIVFKETGFTTDTMYYNVVNGRVRDWSKVAKIEDCIGTVRKNKTGDEFLVLSRAENKKDSSSPFANIEFLVTGYICVQRFDMVLSGAIRDKMKPVVADIGYTGDISIPHNSFERHIYQTWMNMIKRCYDKTRHDYARYGGKGVYVCKHWHCFKNFFDDIEYIDYFDKEKVSEGILKLDKDKKQMGIPVSERFYSKENCSWLTTRENNQFISKKK